jgi:hypothetical protein
MLRRISAQRRYWMALIIINAACRADVPEDAAPADEAGWSGMAQLGAGYDTNANASRREQSFLGFILDPRYVQAESTFGELTLGANNTLLLGNQRGINSSVQVAHRINPDARFADQTVAAMSAEAVLLRGNARFTAGASGYSSWLDNSDYDRGAHLDLGVSYQPGTSFDSAFTVRTSRISNADNDLRPLDVDRYLAGFTLTRLNLGARNGNVALTLLGGRDAPRRADSPFGNHRAGAQISTNWTLFSRASLYAEASAMRIDYAGQFFDLERTDDQYGAAIALELTDWPGAHWSVTPQLRYERIDSGVALFDYDRIEAAFYVRRQF